MPAKPKATQQLAVKPSADVIKAQFAQMVTMIPLADDDDAVFDIIAQVMNSEGLEGIDRPWVTEEADSLVGQQLILTSVTRRDSDFQGGLGVYLRTECVNVRTGEMTVLTTGSVSIVAQITKLYAMGAFPVAVLVVQSDKPTRSGFYPQHLEILDDQSVVSRVG